MTASDSERSSLPASFAGLAVFLEPRVLVVLFLGFASGLPLALSGSTLAIRLTDEHIDLTTIGLLSLVGLPYTVKFLWAPVVDAVRLPVLSRLFGRRRAWLFFSQALLIGAIVMLGLLDPKASTMWIAIGAILVAAASATQDIVIDAFRVESLKPDEQAAGMAWFVAAYRVGMLVSTAGATALVALLEARGIDTSQGWTYAYAAMGALVLIGTAATLFATEPEAPPQASTDADPLARVFHTAVAAFVEFLTRRDALALLAFVVLFKLCDALAGTMTGPFVISIGFDKAAYAGIVKGVGLAATLIGGFLGGLAAKALPLTRALWIAAILQMASNFAFVWLAVVGVDHAVLAAAVAIENVTGGVGTVIFVAFLSSLCTDPRHTATQFALLTALAAVGRTVISASAGYIAARTGWPAFFALTSLAALPALALLWWLGRRGSVGRLPSPAPAAA